MKIYLTYLLIELNNLPHIAAQEQEIVKKCLKEEQNFVQILSYNCRYSLFDLYIRQSIDVILSRRIVVHRGVLVEKGKSIYFTA
jgi:hypothetical protein